MADIDLNNVDYSNIGPSPTEVKGILIAVVAIGVPALGTFIDFQAQQETYDRDPH